MGLLDFIGPASGLLFTLENILWINLGVFIGCVFAAIPGLSVILCIILFLPVTYTMSAIPGMMFLLGIYCAGGYGGSVSAILINTPGTAQGNWQFRLSPGVLSDELAAHIRAVTSRYGRLPDCAAVWLRNVKR